MCQKAEISSMKLPRSMWLEPHSVWPCFPAALSRAAVGISLTRIKSGESLVRAAETWWRNCVVRRPLDFLLSNQRVDFWVGQDLHPVKNIFVGKFEAFALGRKKLSVRRSYEQATSDG